jgi:hypothetical protein
MTILRVLKSISKSSRYRTRPRQVTISTVKKSVAEIAPQGALKCVRQLVRRSVSAPHLLRSLGESPSLKVGEAKASTAQLLSEDSVLLLEIVDHVLLSTVHPAGKNQYQELMRESVQRIKLR